MPCYRRPAAGTLGPLSLEQPTSASMMRGCATRRRCRPRRHRKWPSRCMRVFRARPPPAGARAGLPAHPVRESKEPPRFVLGLFTTGSAPLPRNRQGQRTQQPPVHGDLDGRGIRAASGSSRCGCRRWACRSDGGPMLVVCDRGAEQVALAELREAIADVARGEPGLSLAATAGRSGTAGGASSGWLTVAALPADGVAARGSSTNWPLPMRRAAGSSSTIRSWRRGGGADDMVVTCSLSLRPPAPKARIARSRAAPARTGSSCRAAIQVGSRRIDLAPLLASILAAGGFDAWRARDVPKASSG